MNDKAIWLELYKATVAGNGGTVPDSNDIDKMLEAYRRRWPEDEWSGDVWLGEIIREGEATLVRR